MDEIPDFPSQVKDAVLKILKPEAYDRWLDTPLPRLRNVTARAIIEFGDADARSQLLAYVKTYAEPMGYS